MTHEELQAIKARAEAATPGPWKADAEKPQAHSITLRRGDGMVLCEAWKWANVLSDSEFIAHARTDVPALVAEVERLRKALVDAWDAGFHSSGDGWNGEYPFAHPGRPTADELKRLQATRDEALAPFMAMK